MISKVGRVAAGVATASVITIAGLVAKPADSQDNNRLTSVELEGGFTVLTKTDGDRLNIFPMPMNVARSVPCASSTGDGHRVYFDMVEKLVGIYRDAPAIVIDENKDALFSKLEASLKECRRDGGGLAYNAFLGNIRPTLAGLAALEWNDLSGYEKDIPDAAASLLQIATELERAMNDEKQPVRQVPVVRVNGTPASYKLVNQ